MKRFRQCFAVSFVFLFILICCSSNELETGPHRAKHAGKMMRSRNRTEIDLNYPIYGIMVTRSDHWSIKKWLSVFAHDFKQLAILDGTVDPVQQKFVQRCSERYSNVIYKSEKDIPKDDERTNDKTKSDQGLRSIVWNMLNLPEALGHWVVIAHPDEFYTQSFVETAKRADSENVTVVGADIFYAGPNLADKDNLDAGIARGYEHFDIVDRVRHCVPGYRFKEHRMFKYTRAGMGYTEGVMRGAVVPSNFPDRKNSEYTEPYYIHYKLHNFDENAFNANGKFNQSGWGSHVPDGEIRNKDDGPLYSMFGKDQKDQNTLCSKMIEDFCAGKEKRVCDKYQEWKPKAK